MGLYFAAYLIPLTTAFALWQGGAWSWLTVLFVYVFVPLADLLGGTDARNREGTALLEARDSRLARGILWLALPVQVALLAAFLWRWQFEANLLERAGWVLSVGLSCGGLGIVIAHELVHRRDKLDYWIGKLLLTTVLYMHFAIEHVRGHHARVATDADPASARSGQSVYAFVPESIWRQIGSAWQLEAERLAKRGQSAFSLGNEMLGMIAIQAVWVAAIFLFGGASAGLAYLAVAAIAVVLLEVVNYVEHYGLRRKIDANGRLEPVKAHHSWNSDHRVSRAMLFELPRHTDHHMNGSRPYTTLQSVPGAPQLPAGYPAMVLLALLPPLWFKVMDPRVAAVSR